MKYDGTMDASQVGVKPIALMMEDFDSEGNIRSSVPVQFLAQVWTPDMNRNGFIVHEILDYTRKFHGLPCVGNRFIQQ